MKYLLSSYRQLTRSNDREQFASLYESHSGLPIPKDYLNASSSQIFGFYRKDKLVGGFILGHARKSRTVALFAQPHQRDAVCQRMDNQHPHTEICCLWMSHSQRKKALANSFSWLFIGWAISNYASSGLLFGTCSRGLANLYRTSQKIKLIHQDQINRRGTYIFTAKKRDCFVGIFNIVATKLRKRFRNHLAALSTKAGVVLGL